MDQFVFFLVSEPTNFNYCFNNIQVNFKSLNYFQKILEFSWKVCDDKIRSQRTCRRWKNFNFIWKALHTHCCFMHCHLLFLFFPKESWRKVQIQAVYQRTNGKCWVQLYKNSYHGLSFCTEHDNTVYSMLYFSCIFLIREKRISVNGKYQRNVLTLKDTYMLSLLHLISIFIGLMVQSFSRFSPQSIELSSTFVDIFRIVVNGYVLPVYILVKLYYKMPEFFSNKPKNVRKFVLKQDKILPRPQLSPFPHLPYIALIRVNSLQEPQGNRSNQSIWKWYTKFTIVNTPI